MGGKKKKVKEGWMMPGREKLAMIVGAGCNNAFSVLVTTFLTGYLLIIGIDPVISGLILMALKIWDAVNDVIFGYIVDRVRFREGKNWFTRWLFRGRYMPWFRFLLGLMPLGAIIIYTISDAAPMVKIVQFTIGYLIYDLGMTASGAYSLLPMSVTDNYNERNFISAYTGLGQGFGSLPILLIGTAMIANGTSYSVVVPCFAIYAFLLGLIPAIFVKERNPSALNAPSESKYTIRQMLHTVTLVPDFLFLLAATFIAGIFSTSQFGLMLAFYIYDDPNLATLITAISVLPAIIAIPFLPPLFKRVNKMTVARICYGISVVCSAIMVVLGKDFFYHKPEHIGLSFLLTAVSISASTVGVFGISMLGPDIIEKARFKSGEDVAGIFAAMQNFVTKLVNALTSSVALFILAAYGWNSNFSADSFDELSALVESGVAVQTERALQGLWDVSYLFPLIGAALAFTCYFFIKVGRREAQIYMSANAGEISHEEAMGLLADREKPLPVRKTKDDDKEEERDGK